MEARFENRTLISLSKFQKRGQKLEIVTDTVHVEAGVSFVHSLYNFVAWKPIMADVSNRKLQHVEQVLGDKDVQTTKRMQQAG